MRNPKSPSSLRMRNPKATSSSLRMRKMKAAMKMKKRRNACVAPEKKICRKITSLDDEELWAEFETEDIDRVLRGEIKPKTMITTGHMESPFPQRGPSIADELVLVFPNSKYFERGIHTNFHKVVRLAKKNRCTSLTLAHTNFMGHDIIHIVSLLNGAVAEFRLFNFLPPLGDIRYLGTRVTKKSPHPVMADFTSPSDVGTGRLIQSLFSKVTPSPGRSIARFHNHMGHIFFRHYRYYLEEDALARRIVTAAPREWGLQFALKLKTVQKLSLDTLEMTWVCRI